MTSRTSRLSLVIALLLLAAAVGWHAWWTTRAWTMPGMSGHEFRQAQTAISIWAMKQDGFRLDYSTPILGKPWSIPFEFPIYEGLAAGLSRVTGLNVVQAGRWVSLLAFYLGIPAWLLLFRRVAGFSPVATAIALLPLFFAPVYILYTRAVMIESTAFSAAAWFVALLLIWRRDRRPALLVLTLLAGLAAVLAKSTTWAVFCIPWVCCAVAEAWRARRTGWAPIFRVLDEVVLVVLPVFAVGVAWVWITDQIKEMNPVGAFLTSDKLKAFNFGTLAQRHDPAVYRALWQHWQAAVMPAWTLAVCGLAVWIAPRRGWLVAVTGALTFLAGPAVFINLYAIHNYYFYASAAAACVGAGGIAAALWDAPRPWWRGRLPGALLVILVCAGEFQAYRGEFYGTQTVTNGGTSGLTDALRRLTKPTDVIVMHSPDWSAISPFLARRRMLIIPDSQMYFRRAAVEREITLLRDENVPLVVFRGESRQHVEWVQDRMADFQLNLTPLFTWEDAAVVYARRDVYASMRRILEHEHFSGVSLGRERIEARFGPALPVVGTPKAKELAMLDPLPLTISTPYYSFRMVDGHPALLAHPATEIVFTLPAKATRIEIGYRIDPPAYAQKAFDGAYVQLELQEPGAEPKIVHEDWLRPNGDRSPRHLTLVLPRHHAGKLMFRSLAGPADNNAFDWVLLEYLRIR